MKKENIEPCDICGMKYTKEMCTIANEYLNDEEPCYCKSIKEIERLINKNRKLKEEIEMLDIHLSEAQPEEWDLDAIYEDALEGIDQYTREQTKPNIPYAKWLKKRYNLEDKR